MIYRSPQQEQFEAKKENIIEEILNIFVSSKGNSKVNTNYNMVFYSKSIDNKPKSTPQPH